MLRYVLDVKRVGARRRHAGRRAAIRSRLSLARAAAPGRSAARRRTDRPRRARLRDSVAHAAAARRERDQARHRAARAGRVDRARGGARRRLARARGARRRAGRERARRRRGARAWVSAPCGSASRRATARTPRSPSRPRRAKGSSSARRFRRTSARRCRRCLTDDRDAPARHDDSRMKTRAVIVEDEPIARAQLRDLVGGVDWIHCVGEAADGLTAVVRHRSTRQARPRLPRHRDAGARRARRAAPHHARPGDRVHDGVRQVRRRRVRARGDRLSAEAVRPRPAATRRWSASSAPCAATATYPIARRAHEAIDQLSDRLARRASSCATAGVLVPIAVADIERLEADDDYVAVHSRGRRYLVYLGMNEFEARLDPRPVSPHPSLAHRQPRPRRVAFAGRGHALRDRDARRLQDPRQPHTFPRAARPGPLVAVSGHRSTGPRGPPVRPLPRRDVLIRAEEVRRIVLPLDLGESRELLGAERRPHAVRALTGADVVHVDGSRRRTASPRPTSSAPTARSARRRAGAVHRDTITRLYVASRWSNAVASTGTRFTAPPNCSIRSALSGDFTFLKDADERVDQLVRQRRGELRPPVDLQAPTESRRRASTAERCRESVPPRPRSVTRTTGSRRSLSRLP